MRIGVKASRVEVGGRRGIVRFQNKKLRARCRAADTRGGCGLPVLLQKRRGGRERETVADAPKTPNAPASPGK